MLANVALHYWFTRVFYMNELMVTTRWDWPSTPSRGHRPISPPGAAQRSGRSKRSRGAAATARRLAVASASRLRPALKMRRACPLVLPQVKKLGLLGVLVLFQAVPDAPPAAAKQQALPGGAEAAARSLFLEARVLLARLSAPPRPRIPGRARGSCPAAALRLVPRGAHISMHEPPANWQ